MAGRTPDSIRFMKASEICENIRDTRTAGPGRCGNARNSRMGENDSRGRFEWKIKVSMPFSPSVRYLAKDYSSNSAENASSEKEGWRECGKNRQVPKKGIRKHITTES